MSASPFEIRLATRADEPEIRALAGGVSMPGAVTMRFAREPDYFLGTTIMGDPCDVLIARHRESTALAAIVCRAERRVFVSGKETRIGYIGQLRVAETFRGRFLVARGARLVRERTPPGMLTLAVVSRSNPRAARALVGPRLPDGLRAARLCGITACLLPVRPQLIQRVKGIEVDAAQPEAITEIVAFVRGEGQRRQFFPAYGVTDFSSGEALRGLRLDDLLVARRGGTIVGTLALWDQSSYRQDVIERYAASLLPARWAFDTMVRAFGGRPLPPPGGHIDHVFAACLCVEHDDPRVMDALLGAALGTLRARGTGFLVVGLTDRDPLLARVRRSVHARFRSDLYVLSWSSSPTAGLDDRVPYVEIATV